MQELYAKFVHPDWGLEYNKKKVREVGLEVGRKYRVTSVDMGQSYTNIGLAGFQGLFNSVQFEFYDENDQPHDIYNDADYNPYIKLYGDYVDSW